MKCLQRFFTLFAVFAICLSLCITCYAEEFSDSSSSGDESAVETPVESPESSPVESVPIEALEPPPADDISMEVSDMPPVEETPVEALETLSDDFPEYSGTVYDSDNPLPVVVVEDEESYSVRSGRAGIPVLVIGDEPPGNPLFYGSGWVSGRDSILGDITIYFPIDTQTGHWGVDANGYLYNITSSSISGYLSGVYNNSVSASGFSYPRYRTSSGSSYATLYLTPENSNMDIATSNVPRVPVTQVLPYVMIFLMGGVFLCCMKRS